MRRLNSVLCPILIFALSLGPKAMSADMGGKGAMEYYSENPTGRLLVRVQVWGDVTLTGFHHVPDDTSLLALIGFAGGLKGALDDAKITLRREIQSAKATQIETRKFKGDELLASDELARTPLHNGDIVYIEATPPVETATRTLGLVTTITSLVTSAIVTYFLIKTKK